MNTLQSWMFEGGGPMPWRSVAVTCAAIVLPAVVAILIFGRVGSIAFVAAMPAHLAAKDAGIRLGGVVTVVMGMAGLLSLGAPDMAVMVAVILGLMCGVAGTYGLARPCIRALLTWAVFTSPILESGEKPMLMLIFLLAGGWALLITGWFGETRTTGEEDRESRRYAMVFGVMTAVGLGISVWIGARFFGDHGFWFPLTFAVLVLPPHGGLAGRTVKRSVGTVLGTAAALGVGLLSPGPWIVAGIGLLCLPVAFRLLPVSYTLFTALLTVAIIEVLALVSQVGSLALERLGTMAAAAAMTLVLGALGWLALRLMAPGAARALLDQG
ncbi:FUSC family protein [Palleronia sediminis]|uniref:FUSC family protein n=1 Tax=Palleronia sediminis TaxID=2547833 RepID=A0A4R6A9M4_9RHOB|nr:FUSC family protein [Palleronia sediminis]TDL79394.1 FUSC family protein [Palleronia sediminis]